jgi:hypothetical protein
MIMTMIVIMIVRGTFDWHLLISVLRYEHKSHYLVEKQSVEVVTTYLTLGT